MSKRSQEHFEADVKIQVYVNSLPKPEMNEELIIDNYKWRFVKTENEILLFYIVDNSPPQPLKIQVKKGKTNKKNKKKPISSVESEQQNSSDSPKKYQINSRLISDITFDGSLVSYNNHKKQGK